MTMIVQGKIVTMQTVTGNAHQTYIDKSTPYTGDYTVTPSEQAQTLQTSGKRMTENVTIEAVPWVHPQGEITLTENGEHDVEAYQTATVAVPQPQGEITITENGQTDVTDYETATVQVPQGVFPEGTLNISENGTYDVAEFESATVNIPTGDVAFTNGTFDINVMLKFGEGWHIYDAFTFPSTTTFNRDWSITNPAGVVPTDIVIIISGETVQKNDNAFYGLANSGNSNTDNIYNRYFGFDGGALFGGSSYRAISTIASNDTIYIRGASFIPWRAGEYKLALRW